MSTDWPVTLGEGDRSMIVVDILRLVWASQYARQDPAMPAPETRTLNSGADIVLCRLLKAEVWSKLRSQANQLIQTKGHTYRHINDLKRNAEIFLPCKQQQTIGGVFVKCLY